MVELKVNFRRWVSRWLVERRRLRLAAAVVEEPNAPVITDGGFGWDVTTPGWADLWWNWTFDHGDYPVANLELYLKIAGGDFALLDTVASSVWLKEYPEATQDETAFQLQVRYRNGAVFGPFSNIFEIEVQV